MLTKKELYTLAALDVILFS